MKLEIKTKDGERHFWEDVEFLTYPNRVEVYKWGTTVNVLAVYPLEQLVYLERKGTY